MSERARVFVALGSNLGDRERHLLHGQRRLEQSEQIDFLAASNVYQTAPVGPQPQGAYLNAVVELSTAFTARCLLDFMFAIEAETGRRRGEVESRWGPRTLDLDLLLYRAESRSMEPSGGQSRTASCVIEEPGLIVPHPRLHERAFVLEPLCELAGELIHPLTRETLEAHRMCCHEPQRARLWPMAGWPAQAVSIQPSARACGVSSSNHRNS